GGGSKLLEPGVEAGAMVEQAQGHEYNWESLDPADEVIEGLLREGAELPVHAVGTVDEQPWRTLLALPADHSRHGPLQEEVDGLGDDRREPHCHARFQQLDEGKAGDLERIRSCEAAEILGEATRGVLGNRPLIPDPVAGVRRTSRLLGRLTQL